jgi:hypothetical protein
MSDHPWLAFLHARAEVIDWLHGRGKSDRQIAVELSMDPDQVRLIRLRDLLTPFGDFNEGPKP